MAAVSGPRFGGLYRSLAISVLLPLIVVLVLTRRFAVPDVVALAVAAVFPAGETLVDWIRTRRLSPLGIIMLTVLAVGVILSLIRGDVHIALVKESFGTGALSLAFFGSLLAPRPLIYYLARQFSTGGDPAQIARWDGLWELAAFRRTMRQMTLVWGLGFMLDAVFRAFAAYLLPPSVAIVLSPLSLIGITLALIVWTTVWARRARQRSAQ